MKKVMILHEEEEEHSPSRKNLDTLGFMMKLSNEESYDEMKIMNFHDGTFK
jgi:hypothetical protein